VLALDHDSHGPAIVLTPGGESWARLAPAGTEANPLFASEGVSAPRVRSGRPVPDALLHMSEGSLFIETVVARDGTVSTITVVDGDALRAAPLVEALRRERFEPARFRGRPVAVSLYRLISRMEIRAPLT
jgi:hypothetical protein